MTEKTKKELAEEVELLDTMLSSLVELLEEKGVLTQKRLGTTNQRKSAFVNLEVDLHV